MGVWSTRFLARFFGTARILAFRHPQAQGLFFGDRPQVIVMPTSLGLNRLQESRWN